MYNNQTYEAIKNRILDGIKLPLDKREGSFINDMISPIAVELTKAYIEFDNIINIAFVENSYDEYLDKKVNEFGIYRKMGEKAKGIVNVTGANGTVIPKNTIVLTEDGLRFLLNEGTIDNGSISLEAVAEEVGTKYNIISNTIKKFEIDVFGVNTVSNEVQFTGGINRETDDELKVRFLNTIKKPMTSGNVNHYEQWALEVDGVGNALVKPLWNGPGTVKVMISDSNKQPVSSQVITACKDYIDSVRPIGATVTVTTPMLFNLTVSVDVSLDNTKTIEEVKALIQKSLINYFKSCNLDIIYTKVGAIIASTQGVTDYTSLLINGSTTNIKVPDENIINLSSLVVS